MAKEEMRSSPHARYNVTFYDFMWNEIESMRLVRCTAHEMIERVEKWNRLCQHTSRDPAIVITATDYASAIGIEVVHV